MKTQHENVCKYSNKCIRHFIVTEDEERGRVTGGVAIGNRFILKSMDLGEMKEKLYTYTQKST